MSHILAGAAALLLGTTPSAAMAAAPAAQAQVDAFLATSVVVAPSAQVVTQRCEAALALAGTVRTALEGRRGAASIDEDFRSYDSLTNLLSSTSSEMDVISSTNRDKAIRDAANACTSRVSDANTGVSLSRPIYDRLSAIPAARLEPATAAVLAKALRDYRLAGVDREPATRAKVQALQKEITDTGIKFDRNIAELKGELTLKSA